MHTQSCIQTKPPSGQGLTLTLKGLCLATVITAPQAGYVLSIYVSAPVYVCVYACVGNTKYGVNSCRHTQHPVLMLYEFVCKVFEFFFSPLFSTFFQICVCANNWKTTTVPPTMLTEAEQLCLWRCLFVVDRQEMRSCWGLWLCAPEAYREARPGQEENTNRILASWSYGNKK